MSDFFKSYGFNPSAFGGSQQIGGFQPTPFGGQKLTPAQQELVPYISQVKQEEAVKEKKIRPVAMIFDLLQRGQYVSANLVDEFVTALSDDDPWTQDLKDLAVGFIDGLTGKRKGSFKDVLDKHTNLDEVQLWLRPDKVDESGNVLREGRNRFLGDVDLADALGLAGDIFLDPLNFIGAGAKATKAARAAAKSFADDSVKMSFKLLGLDLAQGRGDDLVKFATNNFNPATFNKLKEESLEKAVRYFNRNMGDDLARGMNNTWKKNYERALVTSPEDLRAEMGNVLSRVKETTKAEEPAGIVSKMLKPFEGMGPFKAQETPLAAKALLEGPAEAVQKKATFLEDLEKNLFQSYSGAGETKAFTIFGKDIGVRSGRAQTSQRAWLAFKQKVENSGPGAFLSNAWWSVMNHGATGEIRKALGFRNPYEKFIRQTELQQGMAFYQDAVRANLQKVNKAIGDADDELMNKYVRAIDVAEAKNTAKVRASGRNITVFDVINNPELRQSLGIQDADIERLNQLAIGVGDLMKEWSREYAGYEKYMKGANVIENYLPVGRKRAYTRKGKKSAAGSQTPGFSMGRGYTRAETIAQEQAKLRWLLKDTGITPGEVKDMVEKLNIGNVEMDLPTLLYSRAQAQAEAAKRFNLMEAMKEFGLDTTKVGGKKPALAAAGEMRGPIYQADRLIGDFPEVAQTATKAEDMTGNFSYADLRDALNRAGASLEELGIQSVSAKGFDGMLFDKTVAQVFKNVAMATDDKALPTLRKAVKGYMNWWKGIVTMTPGFHARNFVSNQATGFVEHGAKWFSPKHDNEALAMTIYALHKNNIDDFTKQYGVTKEWLNRTLSKEISPGRTYREAADDLVMSGLISESQMGFAARTAEDIAKSRTSINPLNRNFIGTKASRGLGSVIENQAKAKSYILNYQDIVKKLDNPKLAEEAHDFAQMEAKKWFLDYEDLTDFERNVMKNVIPFYSWMRKNTVNQIEGILMYPQVYAVFPKLIEAAKIDDPNFDESLIPEWMKDENLFPVGQEDGRYLMFRPDMPFMGLNLLPFTFEEGKILPQFDPRELRDDLINSLNPVIKQIASGLTEKGYDFFKKEELPERSDAPYAVQLLVSEPKTIEVLDNIIKWAGGRGLNAKVENGKIKMDARYMQLINNYFPLIKQINYALYTGTSLIPQLQTAIEQSTGIEDDYDKLEQALQVMSFWTGIKNYPLDMQEREMQRARGIYSAATERRQADMRNTPEGQARSLASREKLDETVRRMVF